MTEKVSFSKWLAEVDEVLITVFNVSSADLADCTYRDWYEDGASPADAAACAIAQELGVDPDTDVDELFEEPETEPASLNLLTANEFEEALHGLQND